MKRTDMRLQLFAMLLYMAVTPVAAHDIEVANDDGVTIYYNFINYNAELEVSCRVDNGYSSNGYTGNVIIPQTVNYNGDTYPVTSIGERAFWDCSGLTSGWEQDIPAVGTYSRSGGIAAKGGIVLTSRGTVEGK